jgi:hypothetical protein
MVIIGINNIIVITSSNIVDRWLIICNPIETNYPRLTGNRQRVPREDNNHPVPWPFTGGYFSWHSLFSVLCSPPGAYATLSQPLKPLLYSPSVVVGSGGRDEGREDRTPPTTSRI